MPFGAVAGGLAAGIGGSLVSGLVGGSTGGSTSGGSGYYIPTGLQATDQTWQDLFNAQNNAYNQYSGNLSGLGQQSLNQGLAAQQQYGPNFQQGANYAANNYGTLANAAAGGAAELNAQAGNNFQTAGGLQAYGQGAYNNFGNIANQTYGRLTDAGNQVFNTAMDPQSALYNRTVQQLQDQTGATNSMYGLGSSAAGAGVANQALSNFNIDWQGQQLQRQLQGLQGLAGAYGQGAGSYAQNMGAGVNALNSLYSNAGNYGQLAQSNLQNSLGMLDTSANALYQAGALPYNTAQTIAGMPGNLANTAQTNLNATLYNPANQITSQAIPYMNYGQGAQSVPYQNALQGAGAAGSMFSQGLGSNFGNAISQGVQSYFGSPTQTAGYFGSTASPGNYTGTGYGGYGQGGSDYYSGGGNTYGFTLS